MLDTKYTKEETKILKQLENELQKNLKLAFEHYKEAEGAYYSIDLKKENFSEQELKIIDDYKKANWVEAEILNDYANKVKPIKEKAVKRTLNEYKNNPDEILKALKDDLKERLIQFFAFKQKELPIAFFKDDMYKRYQPYLEFLNKNAPYSYNDFMTFFELAFNERSKIIDEAKAKAEKVKEILNDGYSPLRQGPFTNTLTKLKPSASEFKINKIADTATFKKGNFSISFSHFEEIFGRIAGLKTSTHKLLDAFIRELSKKGLHNQTVSFSLDDYMALRGLKDKKTARNQVDRDLFILKIATFRFTQKIKGKPQDFTNFNIFGENGIKNGIIWGTFTKSFLELLMGYNIMPVHDILFKLDDKHNPNCYYFLREILELKNMNYGKANADIISVQTLLNSSPELPTYEELSKSTRNYQHIIEPFERDMDALNEVFTWEYCHSNGLPLTDEELQNFNYEIFSNLLIKIFWRNYPERELKPKNYLLKRRKIKFIRMIKNDFYD